MIGINITSYLKYLMVLSWIVITGCNDEKLLSENEKLEIRSEIQTEIDEGVRATRDKDIELYMSRMPKDLIIHDENGEVITREKQKEYALRDWAIIDTTLRIMMKIDSLKYHQKDSVTVFTSQEWERMMFRRDGITMDTVLTTQVHRETWKRNSEGWFGYEIEELGGQVFINGKLFNQK